MNSTTTPVIGRMSTMSRLGRLAKTLAAGVALLSAVSIEASTRIAPKPDWSTGDIPSQKGRIVLITGGTSGMGYEDALALARAGAEVDRKSVV